LLFDPDTTVIYIYCISRFLEEINVTTTQTWDSPIWTEYREGDYVGCDM